MGPKLVGSGHRAVQYLQQSGFGLERPLLFPQDFANEVSVKFFILGQGSSPEVDTLVTILVREVLVVHSRVMFEHGRGASFHVEFIPFVVDQDVCHGHFPPRPVQAGSDGLSWPLGENTIPHYLGMGLVHLMVLESVAGSPLVGVRGPP